MYPWGFKKYVGVRVGGQGWGTDVRRQLCSARPCFSEDLNTYTVVSHPFMSPFFPSAPTLSLANEYKCCQ